MSLYNAITKLLVCLALAHYASACCPGPYCTPSTEGVLTTLLKQLGIAPLTGAIDNTAATGAYITDPNTQLTCNFENPTQCRWKNMPENTNAGLDTNIDYTLFEVTQVASGFPLLSPAGRQPPDNSKVLFAGAQTQAPGAIWMSDPIACQPSQGTLSFEYWVFGAATIKVLLLDPTTHDVIYEAPNVCDKGVLGADGICKTTIPPQTKPFKLAIDTIKLSNAFAIIDNIAYSTGPLTAACDGSLVFGTTSAPLVSGLTGTAVTAGSQLTCTDPASTACLWGNDATAPDFVVHTGTVDSAKWLAATGTSTVPSGEFLMVQSTGNSPAILKSEKIDCTSGTTTVTLKAWMSTGVIMTVCLKNSVNNAVIQCQTLNRYSGPSYTVTLNSPSEVQNAIIEVSASNFGTGGMAAVDDLMVDYGACNTGSLMIANGNTVMLPYTGAPVGVIAAASELGCTVDTPDACRWGDPDPSRQWYWVDNVDATKLQALSGVSTVPTSGAAYYEWSTANEYIFLGSDELFCVKSGGDLVFNAWASAGVAYQVCAVMYVEAREVCKPVVTAPSATPVRFSFTVDELSTTSAVLFVISAYSANAPAFIMIDNIQFTGTVCPAPPGFITNDETQCQSLSTSFESLTSLPPGWSNCVGCAGSVATIPWVPTDQVLGHHNIRVRGPLGTVKPHVGSSLFMKENAAGADIAPGISILQTPELSFETNHWMSFSYQRGTFGSQLYICKNAVPTLVRRDIPLFHKECPKIAGPNYDAEEWMNGYVGGFLITPDVQRLYFVHTAPWKYSYGDSHMVIDDIIVHEGETADTAPLCLPTS